MLRRTAHDIVTATRHCASQLGVVPLWWQDRCRCLCSGGVTEKRRHKLRRTALPMHEIVPVSAGCCTRILSGAQRCSINKRQLLLHPVKELLHRCRWSPQIWDQLNDCGISLAVLYRPSNDKLSIIQQPRAVAGEGRPEVGKSARVEFLTFSLLLLRRLHTEGRQLLLMGPLAIACSNVADIVMRTVARLAHDDVLKAWQQVLSDQLGHGSVSPSIVAADSTALCCDAAFCDALQGKRAATAKERRLDLLPLRCRQAGDDIPGVMLVQANDHTASRHLHHQINVHLIRRVLDAERSSSSQKLILQLNTLKAQGLRSWHFVVVHGLPDVEAGPGASLHHSNNARRCKKRLKPDCGPKHSRHSSGSHTTLKTLISSGVPG
mmetsp:Transcript_15913/g.37528  ORF Transcript_15913/g.37528 Transcript_15913/m.37528 type:complete len:378 (+) Transcript_15913:2370-3503(+)